MYNIVLTSPSGAWASSCLCAPSRAFRFARPCLGGHPGCFSLDTAPGAAGNGSWVLSPKSPPHHEQQEEKRSNYSLVLVGHRFTGRQAQLRNPSKFVGNPATDSVGKIAPSTTLFQKSGVLRGETPKCPFAYFSGMGKVGPRRVGDPHPRQICRNLHTPTAKPGHARPATGTSGSPPPPARRTDCCRDSPRGFPTGLRPAGALLI